MYGSSNNRYLASRERYVIMRNSYFDDDIFIFIQPNYGRSPVNDNRYGEFEYSPYQSSITTFTDTIHSARSVNHTLPPNSGTCNKAQNVGGTTLNFVNDND